jgi:hypothetical protein
MYLMTLVLVVALGLRAAPPPDEIHLTRLPVWVQAAIWPALLLPVYGFSSFPQAAHVDPGIGLPRQQHTQADLQDIRARVLQASRQGPVLFTDQRQLLTFDYIERIPLVPDYEKKLMMDQAMSGNAVYFHQYYADLASRRFSLIVTEVLRTRHDTGAFSDENNDWVDWVSRPTLCFYQPAALYTDINVELLVPAQDMTACQKFLK